MGGGDKPLLELGGQTMLARILATLRQDHATVAISANGDPARFAPLAAPVLDDGAFAGEGPLAGLLAGLDWAGALLTVPGDTPFIPRGLAARLAPGPACAETAGRPHWLVALWPVVLRVELRHWLETGGSRRVEAFAGHAGVRRAVLTGAEKLFLNVNTPADLAAARERLRDG